MNAGRPSLQLVGAGNLSTRVYQALREGLIAGKFHPGQRLVMQELADAFGTSVTPVREACLRLVSEYGLELRSGRFAMVPHATLQRYMEIRTIRMALEGLAAELACRHAKKSDIERLTQIQTRFEIAEKSGDAEAAARENRDFHFSVYRLSGL
jgi:GntR family transcriptional regulator, colanic acid and biofilm gene transcriptional regulator